MPEVEPRDALTPFLTTTRIIVGALVAGPLFFLGIVLFLMRPKPGDPALLTYVGLGYAVIALVVSVALMRSYAARGRDQIARGTWTPPTPQGQAPVEYPDDASKLLPVFQTRLILGAAIREGAAFLTLIAYMLEGAPVALVAGLVMLAGVAILFPTRDGLRRWLDDGLSQIEQSRQLPV